MSGLAIHAGRRELVEDLRETFRRVGESNWSLRGGNRDTRRGLNVWGDFLCVRDGQFLLLVEFHLSLLTAFVFRLTHRRGCNPRAYCFMLARHRS